MLLIALVLLIMLMVVAFVFFGLLGPVGIALLAAAGATIYVLAPVVVMAALGLLGFIVAPVLRAVAPDTWESINREVVEARKRERLLRGLQSGDKKAERRVPPALKKGYRRSELSDLRSEFRSFSGPQVRIVEELPQRPDVLPKHK